jgi:hypothetical protein
VKKTTVRNVFIQDLIDLCEAFKRRGFKYINLENDPDVQKLFIYGVRPEEEPAPPKQLPPSTSDDDDISILLSNS